MFKIFSFGFENIFNLSNINGFMRTFLDNIDINEFPEEHRENFSDINYKNAREYEELEKDDFIEIKQYEDMYLLSIDLQGIDIRELSIRYDPGVIEINLNRSELEKSSFGALPRNILVKKAYNKKFENIEEIDTNQVLKSIDNGILSMRMQKKYELKGVSNVVDVDYYEENIDN